MQRKPGAEHWGSVDFQKMTIGSMNPKIPEGDALSCLAELFRILGDFTRVRILFVLFESEMCVYDIAGTLRMSESAISHQLRILRRARLVKFRREGKFTIYSLADNHVQAIIDQGVEHISE